MTSENRPDSLAEQAAAWVPPWERSPAPRLPVAADLDSGLDGSTAEEAAGEQLAQSLPAEELPVAQSTEEPTEDSSVAGAAVAVAPVVGEGNAGEERTEDLVAGDGGTRTSSAEKSGAGGANAAGVGDRNSSVRERGAGQQGAGELVADERGSAPSRGADVPADGGGDAAGAPAAAPVYGGPGRLGTALVLIDDDELRGALEAILLVVDEPVAEIVLAQVLDQPIERVSATLDRLARDYTAAGHGFELRRAAGGWRLYTRPEYAGYVERFVLDGQSVRLTQAALETLAVVAYKQPVTRSRISAIRGVNCDGVIRTLVSRGLVQECGTEPESGAFLYRTTTLFLEKLGLDTVDQLPPLAPFLPDDVEEIADAPR